MTGKIQERDCRMGSDLNKKITHLISHDSEAIQRNYTKIDIETKRQALDKRWTNCRTCLVD